ncbi:MAG: hypothetical protein JW789_04975 [Candidatus Aenigmarchaeota archaeon]|nr:hypothetical protein [Candidatus Aenigmarchaeota archaeon]
MVNDVKCNCTVCGSRFRIITDREGNMNRFARYCTFCRSILEETDPPSPESS